MALARLQGAGGAFGGGGAGGGRTTDDDRRGYAHDSLTRMRFSTAPAGKDEDKGEEIRQDGGGGGSGGGGGMFGLGNDDVAPPTFTNRWAMVAPAFATHLCIGSPWAWSAMGDVISREHGFVVSAASDWSLAEATAPLSIVFMLQGIGAAVAGPWQLKVGPRKAMAVAGLCFGGGLMAGAAAIATHQQWLLYAGYGMLAGTGIGLAYTPPLQALINWFPDRKGLASGLCIAGFGSGALVFGPAATAMMAKFKELPVYLGPSSEVPSRLASDGSGRLVVDAAEAAERAQRFAEPSADVASGLFANDPASLSRMDQIAAASPSSSLEGAVEVVTANASDLAKIPYDLAEGVYVVGTGNSGAAAALGCMGATYLCMMLASAATIRKPHPSYVPDGYTPPEPAEDGSGGEQLNLNPRNAIRTPQFALLGSTFFLVACGGMGLFSVAKPMMNDVFQGSLPAVVTASFAGTYLYTLALANLGGRLGWAALFDKLGARKTFYAITFGSIPLYLSVPTLVDQVVTTQEVLPLMLFMGSTFVAITMMGGTFATIPAYEAQLFGTKYVGPIHGYMLLTGASAASLAGPSILLKLRSHSEASAIEDLLSKADASTFESAFGAPIATAHEMVEAKTLTISKLMEIMPEGTTDPTPYLYNSTMYTMAGFMALAALSHAMVKPVDRKYFEMTAADEAKAETAAAKED